MPAAQSSEKFVIVCGMPRSGTNLMRRIVGSHSQIGIPPVELNFFRQLSQGLGVREILADRKFSQRYELDTGDLRDEPPETVYRELMTRYARHLDKPVAGDKSPRNEFYYRELCRFLPDADVRVVHMVRNPFDMIASYKNAPFRGGNAAKDVNAVAAMAHEWLRSATLAAARTVAQPDRYLMVRFEDLTDDTPAVAGRICHMLEVDCEEQRMVELADYEGTADNTSFKESRPKGKDQPKIKKLDSRKERLTNQDIEHVGRICGEVALALGYEDPDLCEAGWNPLAPERHGYISRLARRFAR